MNYNILIFNNFVQLIISIMNMFYESFIDILWTYLVSKYIIILYYIILIISLYFFILKM